MRGVSLKSEVQANGSVAYDNANSQRVPAWTIFYLGARYETGAEKPMVFRLSVYNVADHHYWSSFNSGYVSIGGARVVSASLSKSF